MKLMIVGESNTHKTLEKVLGATLPEVVRIAREESISGLLKHDPTHVIWGWDDVKNGDGEWEAFLTNAQMLEVKVLFLSFLPASELPEPVQPLSLRMPIRIDDILLNLKKGGG